MMKSELLDIANRLTEFANKLQGTDYVEFPDGGLGVTIEHWGVKHLVASLLKTFEEGGGPPNYLVMMVGHPDDRQVEVRLRPLDGKDRRTPAMDVVMLKHHIEELAAQLCESNRRVACQDAELEELRAFKRDKLSQFCEHDWKPLQNFNCAVYGQKCRKCNKAEPLP